MATRTSSQTGNFADSSTWGGAAAPGIGDDFVVSASHVVTVAANAECGNDGATGTFAGVIIGTLTINAVLTLRGGLNQQQTGVVNVSRVGSNTGSIVFNPPSAVTYHWQTNTTGTGTPQFNITGEAGDLVPINTSLARSGNRAYLDFSNVINAINLNWSYAHFTEMGGTGATSTTQFLTYTGSAGSSVQWTNCRFSSNIGRIDFGVTGLSDFTLIMDYCDFRSPRNASEWLQIFSNTARASGTRRMRGCTFHHTALLNVNLYTFDHLIEDCVLSNLSLSFAIGDVRNVIRNCALFDNVAVTGYIVGLGNSDMLAEENSWLIEADNPKFMVVSNDGVGGGPTIVRRNVADGFNFTPVDYGELIINESPTDVIQNLCINKSGAGVSTVGSTVRYRLIRNTWYQAGPAIFFNGGAGPWGAQWMQRLTSNLFVSVPGGTLQSTGFVSQSEFRCNNNGFFDQTDATNLDHPKFSQNSYMGAQGSANWWTPAADYGQDKDRGDLDRYADPQFLDPTRTAVTWYNSILGTGGSFTNVRAEMLKLNGTAADGTAAAFNVNFTNDNFKRYLREGFRPTNPAYYNANDPEFGYTVGAVDFAPERSRRLAATQRMR